MRCHLPMIAVAFLLTGCWPQSKTDRQTSPLNPAGLTEQEISDKAEQQAKELQQKNIDAIVAHKWWKKPPTVERLEGIISTIIGTNSDKVIVFDDVGRLHILPDYLRDGEQVHPPEGTVGKRWGRIITGTTKRPDRREALQWLKSELDRIEYRQGPGR